MTSARPDRRHFVLLLLAPTLIVAFLLGERLLARWNRPEDTTATTAARALVGAELKRMRRDLDRKNAHEAYRSAQVYVRSDLLPHASGAGVTFPTLPASSSVGAVEDDPVHDITISRLRPHRYRVRGHVTWTDAAGQAQRRRFEADLQLGPADDRWRLIDTEFLP